MFAFDKIAFKAIKEKKMEKYALVKRDNSILMVESSEAHPKVEDIFNSDLNKWEEVINEDGTDEILGYYYNAKDTDVHGEDIIEYWKEKHEFLRNLTREQLQILEEMFDQIIVYSYAEGMNAGGAEERFLQYRYSLKRKKEQENNENIRINI